MVHHALQLEADHRIYDSTPAYMWNQRDMLQSHESSEFSANHPDYAHLSSFQHSVAAQAYTFQTNDQANVSPYHNYPDTRHQEQFAFKVLEGLKQQPN
eukprot:761243-Hanusia_phi.AAC.4